MTVVRPIQHQRLVVAPGMPGKPRSRLALGDEGIGTIAHDARVTDENVLYFLPRHALDGIAAGHPDRANVFHQDAPVIPACSAAF